MREIIVNITSNIHLAMKDSLDTKVSKICAKCKQSKSHKLEQTFLNPPTIVIIVINRFDNNNRKLNNVIIESINLDSYQANLKAFIQHFGTTQNGNYTSVIKKGNTWYHSNDNQIIGTANLNQEIKDDYILFYKFIVCCLCVVC